MAAFQPVSDVPVDEEFHPASDVPVDEAPFHPANDTPVDEVSVSVKRPLPSEMISRAAAAGDPTASTLLGLSASAMTPAPGIAGGMERIAGTPVATPQEAASTLSAAAQAPVTASVLPDVPPPAGLSPADQDAWRLEHMNTGKLPEPSGTGVMAGITRGAEHTIEGVVTPANAMLATVLPGAPSLIQKAAGAYFGATMAKRAAEKISDAIEAKTPGERAQAITEAGLGGLMAFGATMHASGGRVAPPKVDVAPIENAGLPSTAEAVASNPVVAEALKKIDPETYAGDNPVHAAPPAFEETAPIEPAPVAPAPQEQASAPESVTPAPEAVAPPVEAAPVDPAAPEVAPPEEAPVAPAVDTGSPTSIRNAVADQERAKRGLPPAMEPARRTFGTVWEDAMKRIDTDPAYPETLLNSLRDHPRALTDTEDATLLHRQITLQNEYDSAAKATNDAFDAGDDGAVAENRLRAAQALDKLQDVYDIGKRVGTETGRGLNARKMAANEDYSLASMLTRKRASGGGEPLTPEQVDEVQGLHDKIQTTAAALAEHEAASVDTGAHAAVDESIGEIKAEVKKERKPRAKKEKAPEPIAQPVVDFLDKQAEAARARIAGRRGKLLSNPAAPFVQLAEHTIIGASHLAHGAVDFAEWSKRMVDEFGDAIKSSLKDIFEKSKEYLGSQGALTKTAEKLKERVADGSGIKELQPMIRRLAKEFVRSGIHEREPLLDAAHDIVKEALPGTTRRQTMDAISGYGDFRPLSKDEIETKLRDLKGQMQQVGKIEDMQAKIAPAKTGVERRTPTAEERALLKEVNELKKKGGFTVTDPEQQLKTALGAVKTRLRNQIEDLGRAIAKREPITDNKAPVPMDAEADALKAQRDVLKAQYDEIFKKSGLTEEQRLEAAKKAVQRSIDDLEQRVKDRMFSKPGKPAFDHPDLDPLRARQKALREELQAMKDTENPKKTPLEIALATMKTRLRNRTLELQDKLRSKDFTTKPRRTVPLDPEVLKIKAENEQAKLDYQRGLKLDEQARRTPAVKFLDAMAKWRRAFVLSGPVTLAKLTAAAIETIAIHPIEEVVGGAISKLVPGVASRAPRHGGLNVGAEVKSVTDTFKHLFNDIGTTLRKGHSELDLAHGRPDLLPREWKDFVGAIHGALKSPAKRNEFTRSFEKRVAHAARNGVDITDPLVQTRLANEAYQDANRSIFLENSYLAGKVRKLFKAEQVKGTGKTTLPRKAWETVGNVLLPVLTVPTNIAARTFEYTLGTAIGSGRVAAAAVKGFDKLTPEQADSIMRNLKRGSLGAALVAYGYYNPNQFGGYYTGARSEKDVKPGGARIDGVDIPRYLLHNPLLEQLQIGATMRRVADSKLRKGDHTTQGIGAGAVAAGLGIAEHAPFIDQVVRQAKLFNPHERKQYMDELAKSVTPALFQWIAEKIDSDANGQPVKRKPETVGQAVEMGIPGMRQNVPKKK